MSIYNTNKSNKLFNFSQILQLTSLPNLEVEILISFLSGKGREFLLTHPETKISPALSKKFRSLEKKRRANWPIAYLIGQKEFYGLNFKVSPATLVPRPETEMIVEEIISLIKKSTLTEKSKVKKSEFTKLPLIAINKQVKKPVIIDLGTGSGAVIIAVASELKRLFPARYKNTEFLATDISGPALKIAKQNAKTYNFYKKIKFYSGNLLAPLKLSNQKLAGRNLVIAANLPYLTPAQIKKSPSISHEPKLALNGGRDGLKYYRALFRQLRAVAFRSATVLCEINPEQTKKMAALAARYFPGAQNCILLDLSGQNRLFTIKLLE